MNAKPKWRWQRLRAMIAKTISRRTLVAHQLALLEGVDHAVSYINGYVAAGKGQARNDHSHPTMSSAANHLVWWRAGWDDYEAGKPMNPTSFSRAHYADAIQRLHAA